MSDDKQNRNTKQKSMILEYLKDRQDTHVRAEDIIHDLNEGEERVGKTTVYRVLKSLETEGKIRKYTLSEKSPACYQFSGGHPECRHHYHLMCSECGKLIHFESDGMRQLAEEGMTMLVVTHEMGFARGVSSKTVFMENGVVVEAAPSQEFFAHPKEERTREFLRKIEHTN